MTNFHAKKLPPGGSCLNHYQHIEFNEKVIINDLRQLKLMMHNSKWRMGLNHFKLKLK